MSTVKYFLSRIRTNMSQSSDGDSTLNHESELSTIWSLRFSLVLLSVPAALNWYVFGAAPVRYRPFYTFPSMPDIGNALALIALFVVIWVYGIKLMDFITGGTHAAFSSKKTFGEWNSVSDSAIRRFPIFAGLGAVLWGIWIYYIYWLRFDFVRTSIVIGGLGHLTAAVWYIPIFIGWYQSDAACKETVAESK